MVAQLVYLDSGTMITHISKLIRELVINWHFSPPFGGFIKMRFQKIYHFDITSEVEIENAIFVCVPCQM